MQSSSREDGYPVVAGPRLRHTDPYFRHEACKRRRDVLLALAGALVGTALFGAIPHLSFLFVLTGVSAVLLAAYLVVLVRLRNLAVEREMKLRYLPVSGDGDPLPLAGEPAEDVRQAAWR
jgi:hypothetical protein